MTDRRLSQVFSASFGITLGPPSGKCSPCIGRLPSLVADRGTLALAAGPGLLVTGDDCESERTLGD
jgi:hypothetical protein